MGFNFPFYIAFLTGVFCAWATHSPSSPVMRLPWGALCVCALLALWSKIGPSDDIAVAVIYCVPLMLAAHSGVARLILESQFLVRLGGFSYSLYLVHYLILQKMHFVLQKHHYSDAVQFVSLTLIGVPICLIASYLFFLAFERPFLNTKKRETPAEAAP